MRRKVTQLIEMMNDQFSTGGCEQNENEANVEGEVVGVAVSGEQDRRTRE